MIPLEDKNNYAVDRLCAILEIRQKETEMEMTDPIVKDLRDVFDDLTYDVGNHRLLLRQSMSYSKMHGFSNKQIVELLLDKLREYLAISEITIIEQRLPLEEVRYKLKYD